MKTEEEIKECEFYLPISENCNEILDDNGNEIYKCSSRQDCYYKQLKRLEFELKVTKADYEASEQENKELKATIYRLESKVDSMCNCNKELNEDVKGYKSALEEISGLTSPHCTQCSQIINIIKEVLQ